ncbi:MAG: glutamate formimidoyltransferase [Bacteroidales bacterium]|jgi:glutamate formiminotransferase/formiminotetrahydrofolate cyclodeaminase|nr:glutamate formimidoyltransferase [Bacteroidales bacterium]
MEKKIIECVPNFSEGRDMSVIKQITDVIESVEGVKLLDVDPGKDTNRTVVTFVGNSGAVAEAAFLAVKKASEVIDMSRHHGAHPRMGAIDVCPFIPVAGITMEETAIVARKVAERIGKELNIPVYCYENAAFEEGRRNLANCREGEYEGLKKKLADPGWKPDFGPAIFNKKAGATAVGARDFLVAFNVNLNTTSIRRANAIASDVREKGRSIINEIGDQINVPGTLKSVKAIGWYIEEYGIAQVSMNLTNISVTPVHIAFDEVCRKAEARGIRVTGSELVGLIPLEAILDAGRYFLGKQQRSSGVSDYELIKIAVKSMGLNDIHQFKPEEKIIEFVMAEKGKRKLVSMDLKAFMDETASESPAPGGGSISSYMGALGVALGTMVANLSSHKKGWDDKWKEFSDQAVKGKDIQNRLLAFVDEDTDAFNRIIEAYRLPKKTEEEKKARNEAVQSAVRNAIMVPYKVMETAYSGFTLIKEMVEKGNPNSVTDAGVGALALCSCIKGAFLNVKINSAGLDDKTFAEEIIRKGSDIESKAIHAEEDILKIVEAEILKQRKP